MLPESNAAVLDVTVWVVVAELLVQVTVSPTLIVTVAGVKAKSVMATLLVAALARPRPVIKAPATTAVARTTAPRVM
jgi:hypothetical protein